MQRIHRKRKENVGLSPYEMIVSKSSLTEEISLSVFNLTTEEVTEKNPKSIEELKVAIQTDGLTWINVSGMSNEGQMREIATLFNIPANIMSDVSDPSLRPQVEEFDDGLFLTLKMLKHDELTNVVDTQNTCIVIKQKQIISFLEHSDDVFDPIRERMRKSKFRLHASGPDYIAFTLLDVIIDNYIYILDIYGDKVETLEEALTLKTDKQTLNKINLLKRELNRLRRDMKPAKEMISGLIKLDTDFITSHNDTHYKELHDNISQVSDMLDYLREVLYDALDVYHSSMSTKLNDIMAVLTVFSVIFIPLTFIAGVYGMNFVNIPELHYKNGYYVVLGVMLLIVFVMLWYFRRKKWF